LVTGRLEVHIVPGSHHNFLGQPFVTHVARIVEASLAAADLDAYASSGHADAYTDNVDSR
jgi:thioesterase domain-containing protein